MKRVHSETDNIKRFCCGDCRDATVLYYTAFSVRKYRAHTTSSTSYNDTLLRDDDSLLERHASIKTRALLVLRSWRICISMAYCISFSWGNSGFHL